MAIAKALDGAANAPAVEVRVRGYAAALGQPADDYAALRAELKRIFPETPIRLRSCVPMANTGLHKPVYTLALEGVPKDLTEHTVRSVDSRLPDRMWTLVQRGPRRAAYQGVGRQRREPRLRQMRPTRCRLRCPPPGRGRRRACQTGGGGAPEPAVVQDGDNDLL